MSQETGPEAVQLIKDRNIKGNSHPNKNIFYQVNEGTVCIKGAATLPILLARVTIFVSDSFGAPFRPVSNSSLTNLYVHLHILVG